MDIENQVRPGKYRHFKGGLYTVIGVARHVDSPEEFVVYMADDGEKCLFVRPMNGFLDEVVVGNRRQRRFEFVCPMATEPETTHEFA